jgi:hypothetical protein
MDHMFDNRRGRRQVIYKIFFTCQLFVARINE